MPDFVAMLLARLADFLLLTGHRPEPMAIPVRHDDRRAPRRGNRRT